MDQIWAVRVYDPLKSLVTGPSLLGNCYLEKKFLKNQIQIFDIF